MSCSLEGGKKYPMPAELIVSDFDSENSGSERRMRLFEQLLHHHIPPQTVFNWEIISFRGSGT